MLSQQTLNCEMQCRFFYPGTRIMRACQHSKLHEHLHERSSCIRTHSRVAQVKLWACFTIYAFTHQMHVYACSHIVSILDTDICIYLHFSVCLPGAQSHPKQLTSIALYRFHNQMTGISNCSVGLQRIQVVHTYTVVNAFINASW